MTEYVVIRAGDSYWDGKYWGDSNEAKLFTADSRDLSIDLRYLRNIANLADPEDRMTPVTESIKDSHNVQA